MKLFAIFLAVWIPLLCTGQKVVISEKHSSNSVYEINVFQAFKYKQVYPLSTVTERIEYIPLEKTDKCILENSMHNFIITSKDIFVFDYKLCYRFDRQGRFLNRIGKIGRGPEELVRPVDIAVDTILRWVYILDGEKLVKYISI